MKERANIPLFVCCSMLLCC